MSVINRSWLSLSIWLLSACGASTVDPTDTNTSWLSACRGDSECGAGFSCLCGVCTVSCDTDSVCVDISSRGQCLATESSCADAEQTCQRVVEVEPRPTNPDASASPAPGDSTSQQVNPGDAAACSGLACEVDLLSASAGTVTVQVDVQGPFCGSGCGIARPTLTHLESGLVVPFPTDPVCSDECPDRPVPTAECVTPTTSPLEWAGEVGNTDATCEGPSGIEWSCQSALRFAPPGRYRAELCTAPAIAHPSSGAAVCPALFGMSDLEPRCASVEFDYPTSDAVIIELVNAIEGSDAGLDGSTESEAGTP